MARRRPRPTPDDRAGDVFDEFPKPLTPIRSWPWRRWSPSQRVWVVARIALGLLVTAAGAISALVLVLGLGPQPYSTLFWRRIEYGLLQSIHAGSNQEYIEQQLGVPAIVKQVSASPRLTEEIYFRRDHLVMTLESALNELGALNPLDEDYRPRSEISVDLSPHPFYLPRNQIRRSGTQTFG